MSETTKPVKTSAKLQIIFGYRVEMLLSLAALGYFFRLLFSLMATGQFKEIFMGMNVELPTATRNLLIASDFLMTYSFILYGLTLAALVGWGAFWLWMIKNVEPMGHEKRMKLQIGISFLSLIQLVVMASIYSFYSKAIFMPMLKLVVAVD